MKAEIELVYHAAKMTITAETGAERVALKSWSDHWDVGNNDNDASILMTVVRMGIDGKARLSDITTFSGNDAPEKG